MTRLERIPAPDWYAEMAGPPFAPLSTSWEHGLTVRALARLGPVGRGLAVGILARRGPGAVLIKNAKGTTAALVAAALPPRRRRIVLVEFLRRPLPGNPAARVLYRLWWGLVERTLVRRAMAGAQVMTSWERERYAFDYGIPHERFRLIRWPFRERRGQSSGEVRARGEVVLASGRTSCDWETLFAAAAGRSWRLVVVCGPADLDRVTGLNRDGRARVLVEVPHAEHARLLAEADVYALVLREGLSSAGQVRLMSAVEAGVPLVASDVRALEGYVVPGETALTVAPGDAARLRAEIERLLADPAERRQLRDAALARAETWTYVEYFEAVRELAVAVLGGRSMERSQVRSTGERPE